MGDWADAPPVLAGGWRADIVVPSLGEKKMVVSGSQPAAGSVLLGIDIGLSSLKVAAFDEHGRLLGRANRGYTSSRPRPG